MRNNPPTGSQATADRDLALRAFAFIAADEELVAGLLNAAGASPSAESNVSEWHSTLMK